MGGVHPPNDGYHATPDLYLQLSRVLEHEIWNHNQTRGELSNEANRRVELKRQLWKQAQDLAQWQEACRTVYTSLDKHRAQETRLKQELAEAKAELATVNEENSSQTLSSIEQSPVQFQFSDVNLGRHARILPKPQKQDEDSDTWRLGFIQDIEEHLKGE
ncbi:hypothetical protein P154DRAFT_534884 [Amniculicola lignicola CBS 123094]|uniref:Uncharacterized protein n=1 Tax=Amniculicola lignicola CBS 123094 TaxID=1392246 RepID=A0A6A5WGN3_9PLEO|nr:hypothetical protein P154DRAFT_534884 [Amniculicola lignicola CBS 123094]